MGVVDATGATCFVSCLPGFILLCGWGGNISVGHKLLLVLVKSLDGAYLPVILAIPMIQHVSSEVVYGELY